MNTAEQLLDRMARCLRRAVTEESISGYTAADLQEAKFALREYDRASSSQQAAPGAGSAVGGVIPDGADAYTILDLVKRAALFGWQHASWEWQLVEGACDEAFPEFPFASVPTQPTPSPESAEADAPVALGRLFAFLDDVFGRECEIIDEAYSHDVLRCIDDGANEEFSYSPWMQSLRTHTAATDAKVSAVIEKWRREAMAWPDVGNMAKITAANYMLAFADEVEAAAQPSPPSQQAGKGAV